MKLEIGSDYHPEALKRFNEDVESHRLEILHDVETWRHLRIKSNGTSMYWHEIITWPGGLTIHGDMGTFTFTRLTDMFEFFRNGKHVNIQYWAEKMVAGSDRQRTFSQEIFKSWAYEHFWYNREQVEPHIAGLWWESLKNEVFAETNYFSNRAQCDEALERVGMMVGHDRYIDVWEADWTEWDIRILWNLHAIRCAINEYDRQKGQQDG